MIYFFRRDAINTLLWSLVEPVSFAISSFSFNIALKCLSFWSVYTVKECYLSICKSKYFTSPLINRTDSYSHKNFYLTRRYQCDVSNEEKQLFSVLLYKFVSEPIKFRSINFNKWRKTAECIESATVRRAIDCWHFAFDQAFDHVDRLDCRIKRKYCDIIEQKSGK